MGCGTSRKKDVAIIRSFNVEGIARFITEKEVKDIVVMCGAGVSTAAGIPDFRTPGTGLYDNLQRFNLEHPEDVFTLEFFHRQPEPFYVLCQEMWPGRHAPSVSHFFICLLHLKGLLRRCYTQNIDSLESAAGLPPEKLVAAHGNFDRAHVSRVMYTRRGVEPLKGPDMDVPIEEMQAAVEAGSEGWSTLNAKYKGKCKPRIVFFGEELPARYYRMSQEDFPRCDLLLVMGTSLVVQPFAGLIAKVGAKVPRLLMNREPVGMDRDLEGGFRFQHSDNADHRDVFCSSDCDAGCVELAKLLGWETELNRLVLSCAASNQRACTVSPEASKL